MHLQGRLLELLLFPELLFWNTFSLNFLSECFSFWKQLFLRGSIWSIKLLQRKYFFSKHHLQSSLFKSSVSFYMRRGVAINDSIFNRIGFFWRISFISKSKRYFSMKSSTYYFHIKTKVLTDFQICIRVPLNIWELRILKILKYYVYFFLCTLYFILVLTLVERKSVFRVSIFQKLTHVHELNV